MTAMILLSEWQRSQVEFWRKTKYQGYDVSSFGRVRSWWIKTHRKGWGAGYETKRAEEPHIVRGSADSSGYTYLNLKHLYGKFPKVHRLIGKAFIPNPEMLPEINHKTGIKRDNRLDNLEWTSKLENMRHAAAIGLRDDILPKGKDHYRAKISDDDVRAIRARASTGETLVSISRDYPLTAYTIGDIVSRKSWKHIN
jgi:hypothetical protein